MIVKENPAGRNIRGTIEVYNGNHPIPGRAQWYWRAKGTNGHVIAAGGEGYNRRSQCITAADRLFRTILTGDGLSYEVTNFARDMAIVTVPWRLVVLNRSLDVEWIGQIQ